MGVVNVTPDSFSDGGRWYEPDAAIAHGMALLDQGADLLDVGGESTRPGAARVDPATERARVLPVIAALAQAGAVVSVHTTRSGVAADAVAAGLTTYVAPITAASWARLHRAAALGVGRSAAGRRTA